MGSLENKFKPLTRYHKHVATVLVLICFLIFVYSMHSNSVTPESDVTFWLNLHSSKYNDFQRFFSKSWRIFGNFNIPIQIVIENNKREIQKAKTLKIPFPHTFSFMDPFPKVTGYFGQMLEPMINPTKHIKSEFVGFVDTDTFWIAFPTREELFQDGKPIIIAQTGYASGEGVWGWVAPKQTFEFLKEKEAIRCMSMWPLIFKVEHLVEMKNYIETVNNKSTLDVFKDVVKYPESKRNQFFQHFNIMCNYVFFRHKDDYVWKIQDASGLDDKRVLVTSYTIDDQAQFEMKWHARKVIPQPRVAVHGMKEKYFQVWNVDRAIMDTLTESLCYIWEDNNCNVDRNRINDKLFTFEGGGNHLRSPNWCEHFECEDPQKQFYARQRNYVEENDEIKHRVQSYFEELKRFKIIEKNFPKLN